MSAIISKCQRYRYRLERDVQLDGVVFAYFGVNPSTADAQFDDQTVKKWIGFTKLNGGRRFIVGNVFAWRATEVSELANAADPLGPLNKKHIKEIAEAADVLVPCWGSRTKVPLALQHHLDATLEMLRGTGKPILTFGFTQRGDPKHPQMLAYSTKLLPL